MPAMTDRPQPTVRCLLDAARARIDAVDAAVLLQGVGGMRGQLAYVTGLSNDKLVLVAQDVGGSFGVRGAAYPEYFSIMMAARKLGHPVKWVATRAETFVSDFHGRAIALTGELALLGGAWGRRWRIEGGFAAAPWREVATRDGAVGGRFARLSGVLRGCARWPVRREGGALALLGCLGAEAGGLTAIGTRGVATPSARWTPWGAVLLGPAVRVRLAGPLGLWIGVEAVIPLRRPTFTAAAEDLFRVAPVAVRATLGLDLQIVARKRRVPATN